MNPETLGEKLNELYVEGMRGATEILKSGDDVQKVREQLEELKEDLVARFVELGKEREKLDDAGRTKADSTLRMEMRSFPKDEFAAYGEALNPYLSKDSDTYELGASFNVITQYGNFELLRKQSPKEAERLGVAE